MQKKVYSKENFMCIFVVFDKNKSKKKSNRECIKVAEFVEKKIKFSQRRSDPGYMFFDQYEGEDVVNKSCVGCKKERQLSKKCFYN